MSEAIFGLMPQLRFEPTAKRVRANYHGTPVVDTWRAVLLWEPQRVTPVYAVPEEDLLVPLGPAESIEAQAFPFALGKGGPMRLDPRTGFRHHTAEGTELTVHVPRSDLPGSDLPGSAQPGSGQPGFGLPGSGESGPDESGPDELRRDSALEGAAFRLADPSLADYVVLSFAAFDWLEDEEPILGHPRDPFHRVDVRLSSQHRRNDLAGVELANTRQAQLLYETMLPVRAYVPREDVRLDVLVPSRTRTICPYKGIATYWSLPDTPGGTDIAWSYEEPLPECSLVAGLLCFFEERLDATVDGVLQPRPITPWS
jgi:uncharacterized protein (DUF427 family)